MESFLSFCALTCPESPWQHIDVGSLHWKSRHSQFLTDPQEKEAKEGGRDMIPSRQVRRSRKRVSKSAILVRG
jgi:hypothetical protein